MKLAPNFQGALYMVIAMFAFTFNDALVKEAAQELPLFQVVALRSILTSILLIGLAIAMGQFKLRIPKGDRIPVFGRTLAEVAAMATFLTALTQLPIANVTAILAALPLTVSLAGAVFLNEPVGWRRLAAILVGFVGVMLIVQPGGAGFNIYALLALLAVVILTARDLFTRQFSDAVPSLTVAAMTAVAVTLFSALFMIGQDWQPVPPQMVWVIVKAAGFVFVAYLFSVMVMRVGEIGFVAPFRYTAILWALGLGWWHFGEWPDNLALLGTGIIVATGVFTLYRERASLMGTKNG